MKILGSDFDGTLNHNGIDDAKIQAIGRWRSEGNIFAIVSGRSIDDLLRIYNGNSFECDYLIGSNGAVIAKVDGTVISSIQCDGSIATPLLNHLLKNGCSYAYVTTNFACEIYADKGDCDRNGKYTFDTLPEISYFNQISAKCSDNKKAEEITESVRECFGDALNPLKNGAFVDIVRADINKANGLYILMNLLGAKYEDVTVVGDNVNDKDMIEEFNSYAMENGVDTIKKLADHITPGVAELIEKELSGNK